jgi:hypothetical protein
VTDDIPVAPFAPVFALDALHLDNRLNRILDQRIFKLIGVHRDVFAQKKGYQFGIAQLVQALGDQVLFFQDGLHGFPVDAMVLPDIESGEMRFEYMDLVHKGFQLVEMEAVVVLDKGRLDSDEGIDNLFIADRLGRVVHGHVKPARNFSITSSTPLKVSFWASRLTSR